MFYFQSKIQLRAPNKNRHSEATEQRHGRMRSRLMLIAIVMRVFKNASMANIGDTNND